MCQHHPNGVGTENPLGAHGVRAQIRGSRVARSSCGFSGVGLVEQQFWEDDRDFSPSSFFGKWFGMLRHVICP